MGLDRPEVLLYFAIVTSLLYNVLLIAWLTKHINHLKCFKLQAKLYHKLAPHCLNCLAEHFYGASQIS